jgi:predicted dehydrogenase
MLVPHVDQIRLAMLGMVDGNGHPYSWSAIINGQFDRRLMAQCPYPVISEYLGAQPAGALGIPGARVTHIWCDDRQDAERVAAAAYIPTVVAQPTDVIGQVDAVIIPTDKPEEHLARARPFIEAGIPIFIDKPLTDDLGHLRQFAQWQRDGRPILSTSCMRYSTEFETCRSCLGDLGELRLLTLTMCKSWERYGIHALEGVYPFLPPGGWESISHRGDDCSNLMHLHHQSGVEVILSVIADMYGSFGVLGAFGTKGNANYIFKDTFHAFKAQLVAMVGWLRTGRSPVPFEQTIELMKIIIAGKQSRADGGRVVPLSEIHL